MWARQRRSVAIHLFRRSVGFVRLPSLKSVSVFRSTSLLPREARELRESVYTRPFQGFVRKEEESEQVRGRRRGGSVDDRGEGAPS